MWNRGTTPLPVSLHARVSRPAVAGCVLGSPPAARGPPVRCAADLRLPSGHYRRAGGGQAAWEEPPQRG